MPAVIPIVIYQGKPRWKAPIQLLEMTDLPPKLKDQFRSLLLSSGFLLINLNELDIQALRCGFILKLSLGLMNATAHGRQVDWPRINADLLNKLLSAKNGPEILRLMLTYIFHTEKRTKASTWRAVADNIIHNRIRTRVMTLAESLKQEGRREGEQKGRQEGRQEGVLMGEIRLCETLLGKPVRSLERLASLSPRQLQSELETLRAQLQASR